MDWFLYDVDLRHERVNLLKFGFDTMGTLRFFSIVDSDSKNTCSSDNFVEFGKVLKIHRREDAPESLS